MTKRILLSLLTVLMLVGMMTTVAFADDAVATVNGTPYDSLKAAIDSITAEGDYTITLMTDISDDITISQKEGVNITVDGNDNDFSGTIYIHGNARYTGEETLTIKNINFVTVEADHDFISSNSTGSVERYAHNVTVEDCSFAASEEAVNTAVALRMRQAYDISVKNCTAEGLHSVMWATGGDGILIDGLEAECKSGVSVGTTDNVVVKNAKIAATGDDGYGVRANGEGAYSLSVENCEIEAFIPVLVRNATADGYELSVSGGTLTAKNSDGYQVAVSNGDYDSDTDVAAPTGAVAFIVDEGVRAYPLVAYVAKVNGEDYMTLSEAAAAANAVDGGATVTLLKNVTLGEKLTISENITITGKAVITRADDYTGTLFAVGAGATLTLDGGLTIDGGNNYAFNSELYAADLADWETSVPSSDCEKWFTLEDGAPVATAYMITVSGADATVNLNDVTVQNHYSKGSGIVSAGNGATVTLTGATITHCANVTGSGLVVNASAGVWSRENELITVVMNEGTVIDGNHVGGNHGIFKIYMGTYFTMNGGEIKNTTGWNSNGTAVGIYHAVFTMNGGTICSNSSVYGPNNGRNAAIYGHSNHLFTMNDGTICHNTGRSKAGVDSPYADEGYTGSTTINGGYVVNNEVVGPWSAPDVSGGATLTITGGIFTQDVSQWCEEGMVSIPLSNGTYVVGEEGSIPCVITFETNGGSSVRDMVIFDGETIGKMPKTYRGSWAFAGWYKDAACTIPWTEGDVVAGDMTLYARWERALVLNSTWMIVTMRLMARYEITVEAMEGGAITTDHDGLYRYNEDATYTITADEGYEIAGVLVDGVNVGAVSEYTFTDVRKDHTITAIFVKTAK